MMLLKVFTVYSTKRHAFVPRPMLSNPPGNPQNACGLLCFRDNPHTAGELLPGVSHPADSLSGVARLVG